MSLPRVDATWTLFLDRDGVINVRRVGDYVKDASEFIWSPLALPGLQLLRAAFGRLIVVTNQQGVAKGLMSDGDLVAVHDHMRQQAARHGVTFDAIYACTDLASAVPNCRKPAPEMGYRAQQEFADLDFARAIMVGDSVSDIGFGESLGMRTVGIGAVDVGAQLHYESLWDFALELADVRAGGGSAVG